MSEQPPVDAAVLRALHLDEGYSDRDPEPWCGYCSREGAKVAWPCDTIRLLDALMAETVARTVDKQRAANWEETARTIQVNADYWRERAERAVRRAALLNDCNGELHDRLTRAQQRAAEYQEAAENYERLYDEALRRLNA